MPIMYPHSVLQPQKPNPPREEPVRKPEPVQTEPATCISEAAPRKNAAQSSAGMSAKQVLPNSQPVRRAADTESGIKFDPFSGVGHYSPESAVAVKKAEAESAARLLERIVKAREKQKKVQVSPHQLQIAPAPVEKIEYDQDFRPFEFINQSTPNQRFWESCIYNTVHIQLPGEIAVETNENTKDRKKRKSSQTVKIRIPHELQNIYLHFDISVDKSQDDDVSLSSDLIYLQKEEDHSEAIRYIPVRPSKNKKTSPDETDRLIIVFRFTCKEYNALYGQYQEIGKCPVEIEFRVINHEARTIEVRPEQSAGHSWLHRGSATQITTEPKSLKDFSGTMPFETHALETRYQIELTKNKTKHICIVNVKCFANLHQTVNCPICGKELRGNGIPGIVLYCTKNSVDPIVQTSNAILNYLTGEGASGLQLYKLAAFATLELLNNISRDDELYHLDQPEDLRKYKEYVRIPLAALESQTVDNQEACYLRSFNSQERDQFSGLLHELNQHLAAAGVAVPEKGTDDKYFLLRAGGSYGKDINNNYIHESMIRRLCDGCMCALPTEYYRYYKSIPIMYFGNSSAGKTVLICSEYNCLENINLRDKQAQTSNAPVSGNKTWHQFHSVAFTSWYPDNQTEKPSYGEIAERLREAEFPNGTTNTDLPVLLESLPEYITKDLETDYLYCLYDMPGSLAAELFDYQASYVYVYSLLEDMQTFSVDNQASNLFMQIKNAIMVEPDWRTNMQIFLTKIDEYPAFLYEQLKALDMEWIHAKESWLENHDQAQLQVDCTFNMDDVSVYSAKVLAAFDDAMQQDFFGKPVQDIIRKEILDVIVHLQGMNDEVDGLTFGEFLIRVSRLPESETAVYQVVLRYLIGLCTMPTNYYHFRNLLTDLVHQAQMNNNRRSRFFFSVYAVSSTGYSMVECKAQEAGIIKQELKYEPFFVDEAHRMMQNTTAEYEWACRNSEMNQQDGALILGTQNSGHFFASDKMQRNFYAQLAEKFPQPANALFANVFTTEDLEKSIRQYAESGDEVLNAVARLYQWALKNNQVGTDTASGQSVQSP